MQQFTRNLTREIEVGGERLALTLSKDGLSVRPVGGRRLPYTRSWAAWVFAWVDRLDAYHTLAELGHAISRGIPFGLYAPLTVWPAVREEWWAVVALATDAGPADHVEAAWGQWCRAVGR